MRVATLRVDAVPPSPDPRLWRSERLPGDGTTLAHRPFVIDSASALVRPAGPSRVLAWLHAGDRALMAVLLSLHLAPLCLFAYFPTRDGPSHLEGSLLLLRWQQPDVVLLRDWYTPVLQLAPNWLDHVALAGLSLVMDPVTAEKVLIGVFVLGLPLAARRAFKAVRSDSGFLAVLTLPFTYTWLLHMGFYNFCLSLPLFFLAVASWLHDRASSGGAWLRLVGWSLLLYFTHPVALVAAGGTVVALAAWTCVVDVSIARRLRLSLRDQIRHGLRRVARTGLAFAPAAALFLTWTQPRRQPAFFRFPFRQLLRDLLGLDALVSFDPAEALPAGLLVLALAALSAAALRTRWRERRLLEGDGFLACTAALVAVYFLAPVSLSGGGYLTPRLMLLPFLSLLLWLASHRWSERARAWTALVAVAATLPALVLHLRSYGDANDELAEYLQAEPWLLRGATVLPLHYQGAQRGGFPRVDVLAHAAAYFAVSRGTIDLVFYEGTTRGIFPLAFHRDVDPYRHLGDNPESVPPCVDLVGYMEQTRRPIDVVLTWKRHLDPGTPCAAATQRQLHAHYRLVHVSSPGQHLKVWRLQSGVP